MLRRINAGLFEEDEGSDIELVVQAQNNNGTEAAQFDYDSNVLAPETVHGLPGCRFRVKPGTRQFRALVVFDPAAPPTARYDLLQVNASGTLTPVGKSVTNTFGTPLIGFGIDGVPVAVAAAPAGGRRKMPKRPKRVRRKMSSARRSATTSRKPAAARGKAKSATKATPKVAARKATPKRARTPKPPKRVFRKLAKRVFTKKRR